MSTPNQGASSPTNNSTISTTNMVITPFSIVARSSGLTKAMFHHYLYNVQQHSLHNHEVMLNNHPMLNPAHLSVLRAVVETGSVTAAAQRLDFTPSAVSQQMASLERSVSTALFEKAGRGIRPTAAALVLAEHAATVLGAMADAERAVADVREGRTGKVRMVSFASAGDSLLPPAIALMRQRFPNIAVETDVMDSRDKIEHLRSGLIDLVVSIEPWADGEQPPDHLVWQHLLDDHFRLLLPTGHALSRRRTIQARSLCNEAWVTPMESPWCGDENTMELGARGGFVPRIVLRAGDFPAVQAYVAAGLGVALVPELALGALREGVVVRRLADEPRPRHVWAATRASLLTHPPVAVALQSLHEVAQTHLRSVLPLRSI